VLLNAKFLSVKRLDIRNFAFSALGACLSNRNGETKGTELAWRRNQLAPTTHLRFHLFQNLKAHLITRTHS
jgi:hypothetical protein